MLTAGLARTTFLGSVHSRLGSKFSRASKHPSDALTPLAAPCAVALLVSGPTPPQPHHANRPSSHLIDRFCNCTSTHLCPWSYSLFRSLLVVSLAAVPAFVKRGDLIVVDDGVNHALQTGCLLSRSRCKFFAHNDPEDLARVLRSIAEEDRRGPDLSSSQRRFVIVEGLYANSGDVCKLDEVLALAQEYKFRILVDDSLGFGVLGETGKGVIEHFKSKGVTVGDVDVLIGSLSTTLASVGGFCAGNQEAVDHQRLSGAGYCFSASCPPFLCSVARRSLERLRSRGRGDLAQLRGNIAALRGALKDVTEVRLVSGEHSPVQLIKLRRHEEAAAAARMEQIVDGGGPGAEKDGAVVAPSLLGPRDGRARPRTGSDLQVLQGRGKLLLSKVRSAAEADLDGVVEHLLQRGVFVSRSRPVATDMAPPPASLRVVVTSVHT